MRWAWNQDVKPASAKLVLLCLANCHNSKSGRCYPSTGHISSETGLDKKTVPGAINKLSDAGFVSVEKRCGTSRSYTLNLTQKRGRLEAPKTTKNKAKNLTQKRGYPKTGVPQNRGNPKTDQTLPKTGEGGYPKTGTKPIINHKNHLKHKGLTLKKIPENLHDSFKEFIDHRVNMKKPLTQAALDRAFMAVGRASIDLDWDPRIVLQKTIDAGWQGVNSDWLRNRYSKNQPPDQNHKQQPEGSTRATSLEDDLKDVSWAGGATG